MPSLPYGRFTFDCDDFVVHLHLSPRYVHVPVRFVDVHPFNFGCCNLFPASFALFVDPDPAFIVAVFTFYITYEV